MKKLLLILSFTLGLTTAANANDKPFAVGDVFFCDMQINVDWNASEGGPLNHYRLDKFKFTITKHREIAFGQSGHFQKVKLDITYMGGQLLSGNNANSKLSLDGTNLNYVASYLAGPVLIVATCDRF